MIYILLIGIVIIALYFLTYYINNKNVSNNKSSNITYSFFGEKNKYLLTKNELSFFYKLKTITDKYNLYIFPKVRLADIINTKTMSDFNKVCSRHIDFTICDNYCRPILFIELDDASHHNFERKENDIKKDYIFEVINSNLIRVKLNEIEHKLIYIESLINS